MSDQQPGTLLKDVPLPELAELLSGKTVKTVSVSDNGFRITFTDATVLAVYPVERGPQQWAYLQPIQTPKEPLTDEKIINMLRQHPSVSTHMAAYHLREDWPIVREALDRLSSEGRVVSVPVDAFPITFWRLP